MKILFDIDPCVQAQLDRIEREILNILKGQTQIMAAIDDLKAGQAAIDKAVTDTAAFLKTVATQISGGVSAADAETIATDLNAQAAALEAAITPATPAPTPTPNPSPTPGAL